ncbi:MAG: glucose 1-dehydrogenase [Pleurocapsa sp. MO_192.B19]|nr:glucose 1-dehydrogenase [Pleurocapsa sp. MO_192.B19]
MSNNLEPQSSSKIPRRRMMFYGGAGLSGLAAAAIANKGQANTLNPQPLNGEANPNGRFAGKVVLITGATSGIGETTAKAFAREGAQVTFNGRRANLGQKVDSEIRDMGGEATYIQSDVRDPKQVENFVKATVDKYGRLDIAFNNAGSFMTPAEIQDIDLPNFDDVLRTNIQGVFYSMKYQIPVMRQQGNGVIVNMASVSGHSGFPMLGMYMASKHAVIGLTKAAALENADKNIRVTSISPLAVDTPMLRTSLSFFGITPEEAAANNPNKRINTTDEMARAVMFLASEDATSLGGMDLDVTGGWLAS